MLAFLSLCPGINPRLSHARPESRPEWCTSALAAPVRVGFQAVWHFIPLRISGLSLARLVVLLSDRLWVSLLLVMVLVHVGYSSYTSSMSMNVVWCAWKISLKTIWGPRCYAGHGFYLVLLGRIKLLMILIWLSPFFFFFF